MKTVIQTASVAIALCVSAAMVGCASGDKAHERTSAPMASGDLQPMVLSPTPHTDTAAYLASQQALTDAEWQGLEKYAPRGDWERLIELQKSFAKTPPGQIPTGPDQATIRVAPPREIPVMVRADGKVQIYYRLWHYGGAKVQTTRTNGYQAPTVKVVDASLDELIALLQSNLGDKGDVKALKSDNMLVITCDAALKENVLQLLTQVDRLRRQVEISVKIFEVSDNFDFELGVKTMIRHLAGGSSQAYLGNFNIEKFAGQVVDPLGGSVPNPGSAFNLIKTFQNAGVSVDLTFQALAETGLIKVVSAPRLTVVAGQQAFIMAGQELPVREGLITNDKFVTERITYKPIGVQLYITPQIIGDQTVKLHLLTIVSAVSGFAPLPVLNDHELNPSIVNPILDSRQAETFVEVPHGGTLVVGGLRMARRIQRQSKVPLLGDMPGLGWLFKNDRSQNQLTDLYFFVTPRLVSTQPPIPTPTAAAPPPADPKANANANARANAPADAEALVPIR